MRKRRWHDILRLRLRSVFLRTQVERELQKELRFHLDQQIEENLAAGLSYREAEQAAQRSIGGTAQIQEECRDMRQTNLVETLLQDLRYASRVLARSPGFTIVMVATLALSMGATTAILSILEGVLIRPLPFRDPARLVRIFTTNPGWPKFPINPNDFRDLRSRLHSFESLAAYTHTDLQLSGRREAIRLSGFSVTAGFFHVLGLKPAMGREFNQADELPAKGYVAIVSDRVWRTQLASRRDVLGQSILLNEVPYTIVGVMPPGVQHPGNMYHAVSYGDTVDLWVPFTFASPNDRGSHFLDAIARLRNNVTFSQAQGELNAAMHQLAREHADADGGWNILLIPLRREIVGRTDQILYVLLGAVALVLLLACVNAANLLLARASSRQREMAVRSAVGAGRRRLVRQMLTESMLLALLGAVVGAAIAVIGIKALTAIMPADFPRAADIHVDLTLFLTTFVLSLATGILFGIIPALHGSRAGLRQSLHESGRSTTGTQQTLHLRNGLVVGEVTLACVLLIGASLMLRSFVNLIRADPGFRAEKVMTASLSLPEVTYKDPKSVALFGQRLLTALRGESRLSAVRDKSESGSAGIGSDLPWTGWDDNAGGFHIQGEAPPPHDDFSARYHMASPSYFRTLGIPVLRGREFGEHDNPDSRKVLIINQALAKDWQHGDPLGGKLTFSDHPKEDDWMTVIGIVDDVKDTPTNSSAKPAFWWPMAQAPFVFRNFSVAIRSDLDPDTASKRLRAAVRSLDANLAVADVRTMQRVADRSYSISRFALALVALFTTLALVMAAIGIYGVISYSVNQRLHEFGVRMALGARQGDLVTSILVGGMKLATLGTALGILFGIALSRLLGTLIYGVSASDPLAISATGLAAILVAALASGAPAIRAARVDPIKALRAE